MFEFFKCFYCYEVGYYLVKCCGDFLSDFQTNFLLFSANEVTGIDNQRSINCIFTTCKKDSLGIFSDHTVRNLHFLSKNSTLISREK